MALYKLLLSLFFIPLSSSQPNDCPISYCGQSSTAVQFPFRLLDQQPGNCGFPGFNLRCAFPSMLVINLPKSGEFAVRNIDYRAQTIQIYDPLNCLPGRLLTFDVSNSPFSASYFQNFTLLSCPSGAGLFRFEPIGCLSNSSASVLATDSKTFIASMTGDQTGCRISGDLRVPVTRPHDSGFTSQLDEDITLSWGTPSCEKCEALSGPERTTNVFRVIAFAIAIPAVTACIAIACCMCNADRRTALVINRRLTMTTVTPEDGTPPPNIVGLDQATIESYTKVVLGESKRLPGHDDATCPICLSEYDVKETVRCIPECRHCFHSECIDEWLKVNGTCPVCRNSPSQVHVDVHVES